ncbi:MAG: hypothetical protein OEX81_02860 [Candidatus Pacebacteria bacterium]|nr:hypothetical protein [Candidatus Paceibacterota bacterium]
MNTKNISVLTLIIVGIYFLIFHSAPFPMSHDAIGLPPLHIIHAGFGFILLLIAGYIWKKK